MAFREYFHIIEMKLRKKNHTHTRKMATADSDEGPHFGKAHKHIFGLTLFLNVKIPSS